MRVTLPDLARFHVVLDGARYVPRPVHEVAAVDTEGGWVELADRVDPQLPRIRMRGRVELVDRASGEVVR